MLYVHVNIDFKTGLYIYNISHFQMRLFTIFVTRIRKSPFLYDFHKTIPFTPAAVTRKFGLIYFKLIFTLIIQRCNYSRV